MAFLDLLGTIAYLSKTGKIVTPLTQMLRKSSFAWTTRAEESFQRLKEAMTKAPVLAPPNFTHPFIVECDASGSSIGAVLRKDNPIAFYSQILHGKNLLMLTYGKEMLALVMAVLKWHHNPLGRKFIVRTNQRNLK